MWERLKYLVLLKYHILGTARGYPCQYAANRVKVAQTPKGSFSATDHSPASPVGEASRPGTAARTERPKPARELAAGEGIPPGHTASPGQRDPGRKGGGCVGSLTIMFSRAYLASQQFRNTGMNKFRKGGQKIYESKSYSQKNPCSLSEKAINSQHEPCREGVHLQTKQRPLQRLPPNTVLLPRLRWSRRKGGCFWG